MIASRARALTLGLGALFLAWLLALGGHLFFANAKVTPEKVAAYLRSTDLSTLEGKARIKAIEDLIAQMNALQPDDRRRTRQAGEWEKWYRDMTEEERARFLEATLPSGIRKMLTAFEELPDDKRKRAIQQALQGMDRSRAELAEADPGQSRWADRPPGLSPELQQKAVEVGLKAFYTESSAQTKAELAPVLEEMQRLMERGDFFRRERRRDQEKPGE